MLLAIEPEQLTPWFVLVTAAGTASTTVVGILIGIRVWWKHRGRGALKSWIHETSGAAAVAQEVRNAKDSFNQGLSKLEQLQTDNHKKNTVWLQRHDVELSALTRAQEQTSTTLRTLTDELMVEGEQRTAAMNHLTENLREVAQMAVEGARHARSRKKHPTQPRTA